MHLICHDPDTVKYINVCTAASYFCITLLLLEPPGCIINSFRGHCKQNYDFFFLFVFFSTVLLHAIYIFMFAKQSP